MKTPSGPQSSNDNESLKTRLETTVAEEKIPAYRRFPVERRPLSPELKQLAQELKAEREQRRLKHAAQNQPTPSKPEPPSSGK